MIKQIDMTIRISEVGIKFKKNKILKSYLKIKF